LISDPNPPRLPFMGPSAEQGLLASHKYSSSPKCISSRSRPLPVLHLPVTRSPLTHHDRQRTQRLHSGPSSHLLSASHRSSQSHILGLELVSQAVPVFCFAGIICHCGSQFLSACLSPKTTSDAKGKSHLKPPILLCLNSSCIRPPSTHHV
jgi:hypothetical protein